MARRKQPAISDELLDQLLAGAKPPECRQCAIPSHSGPLSEGNLLNGRLILPHRSRRYYIGREPTGRFRIGST